MYISLPGRIVGDSSTSGEMDEPEKRSFKCCKSKTTNNVVCVKCGNIFHWSCFIREFPQCRVNKNDSRVHCCTTATDGSTSTDITQLQAENNMLQMLLKEWQEKYTLLQSNARLLEKNAELLNKNCKLLEEKVVHLETGVKLRGQTGATRRVVSGSGSTVSVAQVHSLHDSTKGPVKKTQGETCDQLKQAQQRKINELVNLAEPSSCNRVEDGFRGPEPMQRPDRRNGRENRQSAARVVVGTAAVDDERFSAVKVTKRCWFHLANFHRDVDADKLAEYLGNKYGRDDFVCYKIRPKYTRPKFSSFKVGADMSLEKTLLDPSSWNEGISVCKFDFFRAARNRLQYEKSPTEQDKQPQQEIPSSGESQQ